MKKLIELTIVLLLLIIAASSCTKGGEYIQHPTCFFYAELSDKFNSEMIYLRTDTVWASGTHGVFNCVCNDDTIIFHQKAGDTIGCITGYQSFRYAKEGKRQ